MTFINAQKWGLAMKKADFSEDVDEVQQREEERVAKAIIVFAIEMNLKSLLFFGKA